MGGQEDELQYEFQTSEEVSEYSDEDNNYYFENQYKEDLNSSQGSFTRDSKCIYYIFIYRK